MKTASREGRINPPRLRTNTEVVNVIADSLEARRLQLKKMAASDKARAGGF